MEPLPVQRLALKQRTTSYVAPSPSTVIPDRQSPHQPPVRPSLVVGKAAAWVEDDDDVAAAAAVGMDVLQADHAAAPLATMMMVASSAAAAAVHQRVLQAQGGGGYVNQALVANQQRLPGAGRVLDREGQQMLLPEPVVLSFMISARSIG
uniref:Uncharacterized protein n=1 Tax=Oryza brachyantha TaxID=4533 RepID=J3LX79_ORYBR